MSLLHLAMYENALEKLEQITDLPPARLFKYPELRSKFPSFPENYLRYRSISRDHRDAEKIYLEAFHTTVSQSSMIFLVSVSSHMSLRRSSLSIQTLKNIQDGSDECLNIPKVLSRVKTCPKSYFVALNKNDHCVSVDYILYLPSAEFPWLSQ
jgi:hypothetical protein